mmetsp:Transcript_17909/g.42545  ORF Transcript_17909/g.42545 Transcript_17909/m.42545 type:complete len:215 (+) Transcript_17909:3224-3868(+)
MPLAVMYGLLLPSIKWSSKSPVSVEVDVLVVVVVEVSVVVVEVVVVVAVLVLVVLLVWVVVVVVEVVDVVTLRPQGQLQVTQACVQSMEHFQGAAHTQSLLSQVPMVWKKWVEEHSSLGRSAQVKFHSFTSVFKQRLLQKGVASSPYSSASVGGPKMVVDLVPSGAAPSLSPGKTSGASGVSSTISSEAAASGTVVSTVSSAFVQQAANRSWAS